ncbi:MAG: hypothetical protein OIN88_14005 [Candidatus Methanoperedens sp.]|nr:hypothetical protein [Candidatus Methanoperedens sp.]MCZ7360734.1 hypothetical protein [Candidatus Methanoperedens sp.]
MKFSENLHLALYPRFYMSDLPSTSRKESVECLNAARKYLRRGRIGNEHLLG